MKGMWTRSGLAAVILLVVVTGPGHSIAQQNPRSTDGQANVQISKGDESIAREIADAVSGSLFYTMFDDVDVRVADGVATLTGVVDSEAERQRAGVIARYAHGTWSVDNQLRLEK